jgi:hypothetical protein
LAARIARWLAAYDGLGVLRAGTDADRAAALWLAAQSGGMPEVVPFRRLVPGEARLEVASTRIEGLPLFDAPFGDVEGELGISDTGTAIGWTEVDPAAASLKGQAVEQLRRASAHAGLVLVTRSRHGSLAPLNAPNFTNPFGPPVLQVPGATAPILRGASGQRAVLRSTGSHEAAATYNVIVTLPGPPAPPLVVITPRTSWWTCVSERGGGICAWLSALEAVRAAPRARPALFVATGAHELGHLGLAALFQARPALADAAQWLHLGANLGAAGDTSTIVRSNVDGQAEHTAQKLRDAGQPQETVQIGQGAGGEAHDVMARGGRFVSLIGTNTLFHAPEDRWPDAVDVGAVARIAKVACRVALEAVG